MTPVASREKQPELFEIHFVLQEQGKRLSECVSRLSAIANRLEDESQCKLSSESEAPPTETRLPGITADLNRDVDGYKGLISQIERQLSKIERHI